MSHVIHTQYLGPIYTIGPRIQVYADNGMQGIYPWDDALTPEQNHENAARRFLTERGWAGHWVVANELRGITLVNLDILEAKGLTAEDVL